MRLFLNYFFFNSGSHWQKRCFCHVLSEQFFCLEFSILFHLRCSWNVSSGATLTQQDVISKKSFSSFFVRKRGIKVIRSLLFLPFSVLFFVYEKKEEKGQKKQKQRKRGRVALSPFWETKKDRPLFFCSACYFSKTRALLFLFRLRKRAATLFVSFTFFLETIGFEPMTLCVQSIRSTNWTTSPWFLVKCFLYLKKKSKFLKTGHGLSVFRLRKRKSPGLSFFLKEKGGAAQLGKSSAIEKECVLDFEFKSMAFSVQSVLFLSFFCPFFRLRKKGQKKDRLGAQKTRVLLLMSQNGLKKSLKNTGDRTRTCMTKKPQGLNLVCLPISPHPQSQNFFLWMQLLNCRFKQIWTQSQSIRFL